MYKKRPTYLHGHMLIPMAAANPQRNKTNNQKTIFYGNANRATVSSAAVKRQAVEHFRENVPEKYHGINTRQWPTLVEEAHQWLQTEEFADVEISDKDLEMMAEGIWKHFANAEKAEDDETENKRISGAVLLVPKRAFKETALRMIQDRQLLLEHFTPAVKKPPKSLKKTATEEEKDAYDQWVAAYTAQEEAKKAEKEALKTDPELAKRKKEDKDKVNAIINGLMDAEGCREIAAVGRMCAKATEHNVEAALRMSALLSATAWRGEVNDWTRVDELAPRGKAQSGHLAQNDVGSGTYYGYMSVNVTQLADNLGVSEKEVIDDALLFLEGMSRYVAKSRQTSTAANAYPVFMGAEVNQSGQGNMISAYDKAIRATGDQSEHFLCVDRLLKHHIAAKKMYGRGGTMHWISLADVATEQLDEEGNLIELYEGTRRHDSMNDLVKIVGEEAHMIVS